MLPEFMENQTRKSIVLALKKQGSLSVDDLSGEVHITPMGVRQHLLVLERSGVVEHMTRKQGVGRPVFLYKLTDKADNLFPKAYSDFALDILREIEEKDGKRKVDELFRNRNDRILSERIKTFSGKSLSERVAHVAEILNEEGAIVEVEETPKYFRLKQFNCPLAKVASVYKEACASHGQLLQELAGATVTLQQCMAEGAQSCVYVIPKM
ncbi:MAG TPA: ArsR family transcriptional regulator [Nitrospiraceae bacterium]|jgi:predicted ArsR family transcriptional regulator|nr:ArsR family transcriptional regulator [Nitrospiraceae bacterium]